jgi:hypothetical protein
MDENQNQEQIVKPAVLKPIFENIPIELKQMNRWVLWEYKYNEDRNAKKPWTKVPKVSRNPKWYAKTNAPETWSTFDAAMFQSQIPNIDGIGIVVGEGKTGIDLDACVKDGIIEPWAASIINCINSYTEYSPSGTGIRIILTGVMPGEQGSRRYRNGKIEIYDHTSYRYLTITGHRVAGTIQAVASRQEQLNQIYETYLGGLVNTPEKIKPENKPTPVPITTAQVSEIIEVASRAKNGDKFIKLWSGSLAEHDNDHSRADQALCSHLTFYCGPNEELIDECFKQSGLYRDKWDREDYKRRTIQNSIDNTTEYYKWLGDEEARVNAIVTGGEVDANPFELIPQPNANPYRSLWSISRMGTIPRPGWQIKNIVPQKSITILWGQSGSAKSFIALDWCMSTAVGKPWLNHETQKGTAIYIAAEGQPGIHKRCSRWLEYYNLAEEAASDFYCIPDAFQLVLDEEHAALKDIINTSPQVPKIIVIDTLAANLGGSDSDADTMGKFVRVADNLRKTYECSVIVVHHTGWNSERERGHSCLRAAVDTMISANKSGGEKATILDGITVECIKQKDYEPFTKFMLDCERIGEGDDSSVVITGSQELSSLQKEDNELRFFTYLQHLTITPNDDITPDTIAKLTDKTPKHVKNILHQSFNEGYTLRVGTGIKNSSFTYHLSSTGEQLVKKYEARKLIFSHT